MSVEEKQYLEHYNIEKYERPSVTADMAVFAVMGAKDKQTENYRKAPETDPQNFSNGIWRLFMNKSIFCPSGFSLCETSLSPSKSSSIT